MSLVHFVIGELSVIDGAEKLGGQRTAELCILGGLSEIDSEEKLGGQRMAE